MRQILWPDEVREIIYSARLTQPIHLDHPAIKIPVELRKRIPAVISIISYIKKLDLQARQLYLKRLRDLLPPAYDSKRLMLNWDEARVLNENGVEIGLHTVSHTVLSTLSEEEVWEEVNRSKVSLESRLGIEATLFAYPNGTAADFNSTAIACLKKAGYRAAVTTMRGVNRNGMDLFRLRRTGVYYTDSLSDVKLKLIAEALLP